MSASERYPDLDEQCPENNCHWQQKKNISAAWRFKEAFTRKITAIYNTTENELFRYKSNKNVQDLHTETKHHQDIKY